LLEEEGDALGLTAVAQVADPLRADGTVPPPGLAAGDQPVDPVEVELVESALMPFMA
jgi:hypothetical protein